MTQMDGKIERSTIDERAPLARRERPPPRQSELPAAGLGEVARDVVDHAQVIARDALAIAKLEAKRTVDRAKTRARDVGPKIAFGAVAGVTALAGVIFLLIAIFIALGDPIPSVGWRMAIFGIFFLVVAVIAALFAGSHEEHHGDEAATTTVFSTSSPSEEPSSERTPVLPRQAH
jgi:putative superfamily III holin-X